MDWFCQSVAGFSPAVAGFCQSVAGFSPAVAGFCPAVDGFSLAVAGFRPAVDGFRPAMGSLNAHLFQDTKFFLDVQGIYKIFNMRFAT